MKVLKHGRPQRGWSHKYSCTGNGNGGAGCGAKLMVELDDLFATMGFVAPPALPNVTQVATMGLKAVSFACPECSAITDVPKEAWPTFTNLPDYSTWAAAKAAKKP